ncbi:sensor histidine kinase [Aciduricibacillus chroicocephali]|uniref:Sensor histidine kinase n=1 Tax=Aciduricibacillus chroicocephali TaxID=3054939 RepID=A0ABY9KWW5_9BACI|nr:sensor histidine kinase [Bacillaceae bacterium 44XB]
MKQIFRQFLASILYSALIMIGAAVILFFFFPLEDWTLLYKKVLYDVPFIIWFLSIAVMIGGIAGLIIGIRDRTKIHKVEKGLDDLIREQKVSTSFDKVKELEAIQYRLHQLQEIFRLHAEQSQKLATKRSESREQSLQEVVIQERNRLARELHDSVSQQLFAASMMMSAFNEMNHLENETGRKQLQMIENMIQQSQMEMRALLLHLRPVPLKGKSLQEGTRELLTELKQKIVLEIDWKIEDFPIEKGIEDQLFRILQESVSNTLRHAEATQLHVLLIQRDEWIILRVTDDGKGFDVNEAKTTSYGLSNMNERAFEAGGTFKVVSLPGDGTILEVKVPIFADKAGELDD